MAYCNDTSAPTGHPLFNLAEALKKRAERLAERRGLKRMLDLDDHLLRDVGMTRDQVRRSLQKNSPWDAASDLHRLSLTQRTPWM